MVNRISLDGEEVAAVADEQEAWKGGGEGGGE